MDSGNRINKLIKNMKPIVESNSFIVLEKYDREWTADQGYQYEVDLECELIQDLCNQGYEHLPDLKTPEALLKNVRVQLQILNNIEFTDGEWQRFLETWLDKPNDSIIDKTRKIHNDHRHDFVFNNGSIKNIELFDKKEIPRNKLQVIRQFEQTGTDANRYDVTLLVNGLPLVQIELKKRGEPIRKAFNQIHRYSKESFNSDHSLYKYLQLFVISNGTDTRYFANTTKRNKNSFDFTINWAEADNSPIKDLKDFTATFLQKHTLLSVLLRYSVFDVNDTLLVMRPYQIAATERILWKIKSSFEAKNWNKPEGGGYIWHTTGSGKTLTSFKVARLATELEFVDKVFFVVDRKDLDHQTMKEYQRFSPDSVNGSNSTAQLKRNLDKEDNKIIVTTIQKLNNLLKSEDSLAIFRKSVVFIFDECHRSQFGEAQKNLKRRFKKFIQFGFTGTPIFPQNSHGSETTGRVFGQELHSYVITHAIRDEKVLKFMVDYNDVRPQFKDFETERDEKKLTAAENQQALQHPERIHAISQYILNTFRQKTHRLQGDGIGFNAMFAVSSVDAAKLYYESLNQLQNGIDRPLKIATIFSFAQNEEQYAVGDIPDESFDLSAMNSTAKEFLRRVIADYNASFKTNYGVDSYGFQNYYRDLAERFKSMEIDLLVVVGMFLTGFDAQRLNTLFVDKNLRYHGLIQAYSRTNRIHDATKAFGNIVTFRNLEQATVDAITLFGDSNTKNVVLEKSYPEYMEGFIDNITGETRRGFKDVIEELQQKFPDPHNIVKEADKKNFVILFGEYLRMDNMLQNYDKYASLKAFQNVDMSNAEAVSAFKRNHYVTDDDLTVFQTFRIPGDRKIQDYCSTYNDIRDWSREQRAADEKRQSTIDWDGVDFEVDLLKSQEINLDYILELIIDYNKKTKRKSDILDEARRLVRSSIGNRAKESLLVDFISHTDLEKLGDKSQVMDAFFKFARAEQRRKAEELISTEGLNSEAARRYIAVSIKHEFASDTGTELNDILPRMSPLSPQYLTKKQAVFHKIESFVEEFKGIGGEI